MARKFRELKPLRFQELPPEPLPADVPRGFPDLSDLFAEPPTTAIGEPPAPVPEVPEQFPRLQDLGVSPTQAVTEPPAPIAEAPEGLPRLSDLIAPSLPPVQRLETSPDVSLEDEPDQFDPEIAADMAERLPDISGLLPGAKRIAEEIPYLVARGARGTLQWLAPIMGYTWYVDGQPIGAQAWRDMFDEAVDFWAKRRGPEEFTVPNYGIEPVPGKLRPRIVRLPDVAVRDILGDTVELGGAVAGPVRFAMGAGRLAVQPLADPRISRLWTNVYARPFFRDILAGMIGGALLGEGELERSIENMALFALFEAAGYTTRIPETIRKSTAWRKMTVRERGLMLQTIDDTIHRSETGFTLAGEPDPYWQRRPSITENELLRRWNSKAWRDEATRRREIQPDQLTAEEFLRQREEVVTREPPVTPTPPPDFELVEPPPVDLPPPAEVTQLKEPILSAKGKPFKTERGARLNIPKAQKQYPAWREWTVVPFKDGFGLLPRHQVPWQQTLEEYTERFYLQGRRFEDVPDEDFRDIVGQTPGAEHFTTVPFDTADHKAAMRAFLDDRVAAIREMGGVIRKELAEKRLDGTPRTRTVKAKHYREVEAALKAGLPVPPEVRADYPALRGEVAVPGEIPDVEIPERPPIEPGMIVDTTMGRGEVVGVTPTRATVRMPTGRIENLALDDITPPPEAEELPVFAIGDRVQTPFGEGEITTLTPTQAGVRMVDGTHEIVELGDLSPPIEPEEPVEPPEAPVVEIEPVEPVEEEPPAEPPAVPPVEGLTVAEQVEGFARGKIKDAFINITDQEVNRFLADEDPETVIRDYLDRVTYTGDIEAAVEKGLRDITDIMDVLVPEFEKRVGLGLRPEPEEVVEQVLPDIVGVDSKGDEVRIGDRVAYPGRFPMKPVEVVRRHPSREDIMKVRLVGQKREYNVHASDITKVIPVPAMPPKAQRPKIKTLIGWFRANPVWDRTLPGETAEFNPQNSGVIGLVSKERGKPWDELELLAKEDFILIEGQTWEDLADMLRQEIMQIKAGKPPSPLESFVDMEKELERQWQLEEEDWIAEIQATAKELSVAEMDLKLGDRIHLVLPNGDAQWMEVSQLLPDGRVVLSDGADPPNLIDLDLFDWVDVMGGKDFGLDKVEFREDTPKRVTLEVKPEDQIPSLNTLEQKLIKIMSDDLKARMAVIKIPAKQAAALDKEIWLSHEAQLRNGMRSQYDRIGWSVSLVRGDATGDRVYDIQRPYGVLTFDQGNNTLTLWPRYEDLISASKTQKMKPSLDEERIVKTSLMRDVLNQQPARSIPNELLQNSFDAMPLDRPSDQQVIKWYADQWRIEDEDSTVLKFEDNGRGMAPFDFAYSYLKIGAVGKDSKLFKGGFGKANAALLYFPNKIKVVTTAWAVEDTTADPDTPDRWKEGQNEEGMVFPDAVKIRTTLEATQEEMFAALSGTGDPLDVQVTERNEIDLDEPTGTYYEAHYTDKTEGGWLKLDVEELMKGFNSYIQELRHKAVVIETGVAGNPDNIVMTKDFDDFKPLDLIRPMKEIESYGSKIKIYLVNTGTYTAPKWSRGYEIAQKFYNKGLPLQIDKDDISGINRLPFEPDFKIYVNFTETPRVEDEDYPFIKNRTEVLYRVGREIADAVNEEIKGMADKYFDGQVSDFNRMLKQSPTIEGVLVTLPYKDPADLKVAKDLVKKHRPVFRGLAKLLNMFQDLNEEAGLERVDLVLTTHPGLHGYRSNPDRGVREIYALNPFSVNAEYLEKPFYKERIEEGVEPILLQAENLIATFMHEYAHKDYPTHDADWGGNFTENFTKMTSFRYALLGRESYEFFKKHEKGIRELAESFADHGRGGLLIAPESALNLHQKHDSGRIKGSSPESKVGGTFAQNRIQYDLFGEHQKLDHQEELPSSPEDFLKRSFPDATPAQIDAMLEDPKLRKQIAQGNISTALADEISKKYNLAKSATQRELFPEEAKGQGDLFDLSRKGVGDEIEEHSNKLGKDAGVWILKGESKKPEGTPFESADEGVQERVESSRGATEETWLEILIKKKDDLKRRATREFEHLPKTKEFAELRNALLRLQKQKGVVSRATELKLREITQELNKTDEIDFTWKVILDDLMEEVLVQRERGVEEEDIGLPYGYTPETLATDAAALDKHIQGNVEIEKALARRKEFWESLRADYIRAMKVIGFDVSKYLKRDFYFRHQVLHYVNVMGLFGSGERLRTPNYRSHLRPRTGSSADINADYYQAETEVVSQMLYDIEIARTIDTVNRFYNIQDEVKAQTVWANDKKMLAFFDELASALDVPFGQEAPTAEDLYKQILNKKMAIGFDKLGQLAAMQELPTGKEHEWEWLTIELGDNWLANKALKKELGKEWTSADRILLPERAADAVIRYAAWLLKNHGGEPGSGAAATIFKGINEKRKTIQETLGKEYLEWRDMVPEGYTTWQPWEGTTFFMAHSVPETIAKRLLEDEMLKLGISQKDLRQGLMRGGRRREYVVKQEVADTLNQLSTPKVRGALGNVHAYAIKRWKIWQLVSPRRFGKYNFRNLTGDADATFVGSPAIFKQLPQAWTDLWEVFYNKQDPAKVRDGTVKEWLERGGWGATLQAQEMGEFKVAEDFVKRHREKGLLNLPGSVWRGYWKTVRLTTDFREALLRYAAYLEAIRVMEASPDGMPPEYWASIPEEIQGLSDIRDRAYFLSNDLLGAYDRVSVIGQELRERYFPFWSWKAVNFVRYVRLFRNAANDNRFTEALGRKAAGTAARTPFIAMRIGKFLLKAFALYAATFAIANLLFPREEEDLPDEIRGRPHLVFGRDSDGNVQYFPRIGALGDNLEWFGLDAAPYYINQWMRGRLTLPEIAKDMAKSPFNVVVQGGVPFIKLAGELITHQATFPDIFKPRTIRDRNLHIARAFGLENEYLALFDRPSRPYIESAKGVFIYTIDPLQAAYRDVLDEKTRYMKKIGKHSVGFHLSDRGNALYNTRLAMRYNDMEAAIKFMAEYLNYGGTLRGLRQSLQRMHPLSELNAQEKIEFVASLDERGLAQFVRALKFWEELVLATPPEEKRATRKRLEKR